MSTAAQDEYNDLVARNNRSQITHHPEDSFSTSDTEETVTQATNSSSTLVEPYHTSAQHSKTSLRSSKYNAHDSSDDDSDPELAARARKPTPHYIPDKHGYEERTGPKGVIADARAFERERRSGNKNTYVRTEGMVLPKMQKLHITGEEQYRRRRAGTDGAGGDEEENEEEDDEDDEDFVRSWREKRSEEMRNGNVALNYGRRKGRYGTMRTVDAMGFLRAVDSQPSGTVVLVFVFDAESSTSESYHAQLQQLALKYADALFVALDYEDGEIERAGVPALLAYRNGEQFDNLTPLKVVVSASSGVEALEKMLKEYVSTLCEERPLLTVCDAAARYYDRAQSIFTFPIPGLSRMMLSFVDCTPSLAPRVSHHEPPELVLEWFLELLSSDVGCPSQASTS